MTSAQSTTLLVLGAGIAVYMLYRKATAGSATIGGAQAVADYMSGAVQRASSALSPTPALNPAVDRAHAYQQSQNPNLSADQRAAWWQQYQIMAANDKIMSGPTTFVDGYRPITNQSPVLVGGLLYGGYQPGDVYAAIMDANRDPTQVVNPFASLSGELVIPGSYQDQMLADQVR